MSSVFDRVSADHRVFLFPDLAKDLPGIQQTRFRKLAVAFQTVPPALREKAKRWLNRGQPTARRPRGLSTLILTAN
jgi:hypothetical protein